MFKVRYNQKSITAKVKAKIDEVAEEEVKPILKGVATDLANRTLSFTDTGAYAESFSVSPAGGRGIRRVSSKGRPKNQDRATYRAIAESNMHSDIDAIDITEDRRVIFKNGAPHARKVEDKYLVFASVRDRKR